MIAVDETATGLVASPLQAEALTVSAACIAVAALEIKSQAQVDALGAGIKDIKARLKFLESARKERTAPPLAEVEAIREEYRPVESAYSALEVATKARMLRYNQETRAAAEARQAEALASQQAAHVAALSGDVPTAVALQQASFEAITSAPQALKASGIGSRFEWRIKVTDAEKVPRAYMVVDEAAIVAEVRSHFPKAEAGKKPPELGRSTWAASGVEVYLHEIIVAR